MSLLKNDKEYFVNITHVCKPASYKRIFVACEGEIPEMTENTNSHPDTPDHSFGQNLKCQFNKNSFVVTTEQPVTELDIFHAIPRVFKELENQLKEGVETLRWVREWVDERFLSSKRSNWIPIVPVPNHIEFPDIARNKYLDYMLKDGYALTSNHAYRDHEGNLKGYVVRFEGAIELNGEIDIKKSTLPLAYCINEKGLKHWRWRSFDAKNKTPYGIEKLAHNPDKQILVVEGEKTCDAAQQLLPEYLVLTWGGGAGNVDKTNWQCLVGRAVIIWPDHDYNQSGQQAANTLQSILHQLNKKEGKECSVHIVSLPNYLPDTWDLANILPEGWTLTTIKEMIQEAQLRSEEEAKG